MAAAGDLHNSSSDLVGAIWLNPLPDGCLQVLALHLATELAAHAQNESSCKHSPYLATLPGATSYDLLPRRCRAVLLVQAHRWCRWPEVELSQLLVGSPLLGRVMADRAGACCHCAVSF